MGETISSCMSLASFAEHKDFSLHSFPANIMASFSFVDEQILLCLHITFSLFSNLLVNILDDSVS